MRVLIQDSDTGRFYSDSGDWTQWSEAAKDFKTTLAAAAFMSLRGHQRLRILVECDQERETLAMGKNG